MSVANKSVAIEKATFRASAVVQQLNKVTNPVLCSVAKTTVHEDFDEKWAKFFPT